MEKGHSVRVSQGKTESNCDAQTDAKVNIWITVTSMSVAPPQPIIIMTENHFDIDHRYHENGHLVHQ